jgi:hypothetical protein
MAKAKGGSNAAAKVMFKRAGAKKRTSIGMGKASRPKNKAAKRDFKRYRGQGRP